MVAMKTNVKFLALAVVATAFATSCVKEDIAEENIKDNQDKTEVEITGQVFEAVMENTKSTLVDKTPTWVEEDVIALFGNGSESAVQLTYAGENKFQTAAGVTVEGPYYAIYPYDENHTVDQTTGIFTATVPAEQTIAQGQNVAAGALASVAYSEDTQLYFRNAVSLIRIENKREDIVSIKIESTNAEQMLAGTFTMDLNPDKEAEGEEPAVTMTEGTAAAITLKPEGETFLAGELYAAVLPTNLDGIKVTFERKGETKNETATVTKTATVELERNGGANLGAFFSYEIKNAQELLAWNKACAKWTAWDVVTLTDNINCKDVINSENWIPNKFTGTFDGKGKTIDNFVIELAGPAAFFGRTNGSAVVKDLTFGEGCSFTTTASTPVSDDDFYSNNRMYAAAVVCEAKDKSTFSNIKNYGSVTATGTSASNGNYIAGIVASHESTATVSDCDNYGTVIFNTIPNSWVNLGGCFGQITKATTLEYCNNHGSVKFTGTNSNSSRLNMAGITGGANDVTFSNCKNLGTVEHNATASHAGQVNLGGFIGYNNAAVVKAFIECANGSSGTSQGALINNAETTNVLCMGGCIAYINGYNTSIDGFINYAPITNNKNSSNTIAMGGIVGQIQNASKNTITNCENNGAIKNAPATTGNLYAGGIVGWLNKSNTSFDKVTNKSSVAAHGIHYTSEKHCSLGGVVGCSEGATYTVTNATNSASVSSWSSSADFKSSCEAGGIIGFINGGTITIGDATKDGVKNSGIITVKRAVDFTVGGIVGKAYGSALNITNAKNTKDVVQDGWGNDPTNGNGLGGILGMAYSSNDAGAKKVSISHCTNEGEVKKTGGANSGTVDKVHLGGIVGHLLDANLEAEIMSCTNSGNITFLGDGNTYRNSKSYTYTGGIIGFFACPGKIQACTNTGVVKNNINANNETSIKVGGIVGGAANGTITQCTNTGTVLDNNKADAGQLGGIAGAVLNREMTMTGCSNSGSISGNFKGTTGRNVRIGGIVGMSYKALTMTDCHNTGSITQLNSSNTEYIGGLVGQIEKNLTTNFSNCSVKSVITPAKTTFTYAGLVGGRVTDQSTGRTYTTISGVTVSGTFAGVEITTENYGTYTFGTGSDYGKKSGHETTGITFAK